MILESPFASVFGAVRSDGEDSLVHLCRAAIKAGYAIVPCWPDSKKPMCTLAARDRKRADIEAQEQARLAGHRRWDSVRHPCGLKHAITDTKDSDRIIKRLVRDHGQINIGVELGQSRVIVVDVDTVTEDTAFKAAWLAATGSELPFGMTVASPGKQGSDGDWAHQHGGHYWFALPEGIEMPVADGALKDPTGWVAMWADRQVLVPPSIRNEGPYVLVGDIHPAPEWLLKHILIHQLERKQRMEQQAQRRQERVAAGAEDASVDVWSAETPWADILEPDGWYATGLPDGCGCEIWTAPGVHASPKSATAHEVGCAHPDYDDSSGHLPIHVWTDNPPEWLAGFTKTFSKLQYVALRDHMGDIRAACRALGIAAEGGTSMQSLTPLESRELVAQVSGMAMNGERPPDPLAQPSGTSGPTLGVLGQPPSTATGASSEPRPSDSLEDKLRRRVGDKLFELEADRRVAQIRYPFAAKMAASGFVRASDDYDTVMASSRQFLIAGWLPEHSDIALGAEYKAGKTLISMDAAVSIASGTPFLGSFEIPAVRSVAIMVGEANPKDFYQKLTAICESRNLDVRAVLARIFVKFGAWKLDDPRMVERVYEQCHTIDDLGLITIDPWYLAAGTADGKTLSVMGDVLSNLTGLRAEMNTSLMITTHWNQTGQGKGFNRWTGNGLQEWGRTLINVALDGRVEGPAPYSTDKTGATTARLSIILKGETAGSYRATRSVHRDDALNLDTAIHYTIKAEEYAYDEDSEPTVAEKNQMDQERKSDLVLLRVLQYINRHAARPLTATQVVKGKLGSLGPGSGSQPARTAQLEIAINEGWVEASGKMVATLKSGKIVDDSKDPEKGSDTLVLTRTGHEKLRTLESPHAPFLVPLVGTGDRDEA